MGSKNAFLVISLLAMVLLISFEVSARELAKTSSAPKNDVVEQSNEVNDAKYDGNYHIGGGNYNGGGYQNGGRYPNGGGYQNGGGYNNGHNGGGFQNGGGYHNGAGGGSGYNNGGGYCRFGCCRVGLFGGCIRCCIFAGEAVAVETKETPHN